MLNGAHYGQRKTTLGRSRAVDALAALDATTHGSANTSNKENREIGISTENLQDALRGSTT